MSDHLREESYIPYLDGRLSEAERTELDRHLAACADCRARLEELGRVLGVLGEWKVAEPSPHFDAALRARLAEEPPARPSYVLRPAYALALAAVAAVVLGIYLWPPTPEAPLAPLVQLPPTVTPAPPTTPRTVTPPAALQQAPAEQGSDELAVLDNPVLLENYELLEEFDVLFEPVPSKEKKSL